MKAVVESKGRRDADVLDGLVDALAVLEPSCNRLLEIEVLPRLNDSECELGVLIGRRTDHDRIDVATGKQLLGTHERLDRGNGDSPAQRLGRRICDGDHSGSWHSGQNW